MSGVETDDYDGYDDDYDYEGVDYYPDGYDDDDYDYDDYCADVAYWNSARGKLHMLKMRFIWFIRANFMLCPECHRRQKNCTCGWSSIPF